MVQPHAPIDSISSPTPRFVRSPRSPAVRRRYSRNGPSCQLRFIVPISRWNLPLANGGTASKHLHSCAGLRMPISTEGEHNERSCVDRWCRDGGWVGAFHCPCDGHAGQFPPKSTADLVALCTAQQNDPLEAAAVNFCQGFAEGAVEIALSYSAVSPPSRRPFCLPTPPPSLDQAASDFASWAGSDPARLQQPAVVGLINYLIERYPCPHEAVTQRRPQK